MRLGPGRDCELASELPAGRTLVLELDESFQEDGSSRYELRKSWPVDRLDRLSRPAAER